MASIDINPWPTGRYRVITDARAWGAATFVAAVAILRRLRRSAG
ncbi:MAG: hypothetical protein JWM05_755 [Acidimicrobiales bacterium]|nr:hypothetical protein [Acidimicrobiales bacterium]